MADPEDSRWVKPAERRADARLLMQSPRPRSPTKSKLDQVFRWDAHHVLMPYVELIPIRRPDGTIVLRGVPVGPGERLRRWLRRLVRQA
jgi:hypothetical protein